MVFTYINTYIYFFLFKKRHEVGKLHSKFSLVLAVMRVPFHPKHDPLFVCLYVIYIYTGSM